MSPEVRVAHQTPAAEPSDKRVLVVDGSPEIRHLVATLLTRNGFAVRQAPTCADATMLLNKEMFDALVVEIVIGDGDILQCIRKAAAQLLQRTVVVTTMPARVACQDLSACISKPFDLTELLEAVVRAATGHSTTGT
jgi:DNA-binding response OmpR family regulator